MRVYTDLVEPIDMNGCDQHVMKPYHSTPDGKRSLLCYLGKQLPSAGGEGIVSQAMSASTCEELAVRRDGGVSYRPLIDGICQRYLVKTLDVSLFPRTYAYSRLTLTDSKRFLVVSSTSSGRRSAPLNTRISSCSTSDLYGEC